MPQQGGNSLETNGIVATLQAIGGKWKPLILHFLIREGTMRFGELKRRLPGVTHGTLSVQLRELEGERLVERIAYPEVPPRVEYSVTDYGRTLEPVLAVMCRWGIDHANGGACGSEPDRDREGN
ncbi:winged helix-turn-helix transcriptional regulator [Paenibacillus sp.]|uniref:winged helix-turn-helix transcriptional regulator n=1 Tax=Paenibacillus sp. TaxID=58172 RepID=UPI002D2ACE45|nr:winged helix-turn-helix transcriptional regulator [Paenibacillus sp.]HZG56248.1 winged helix-turn-helix transcriptional regulator [Paenibacillus sp.]